MEFEAKNLPDSELEQLQAEHRHYSELLEAFNHKPYLSAEEQLEEVRLKKLKLHVKDMMVARQGGHAHSMAV